MSLSDGVTLSTLDEPIRDTIVRPLCMLHVACGMCRVSCAVCNIVVVCSPPRTLLLFPPTSLIDDARACEYGVHMTVARSQNDWSQNEPRVVAARHRSQGAEGLYVFLVSACACAIEEEGLSDTASLFGDSAWNRRSSHNTRLVCYRGFMGTAYTLSFAVHVRVSVLLSRHREYVEKMDPTSSRFVMCLIYRMIMFRYQVPCMSHLLLWRRTLSLTAKEDQSATVFASVFVLVWCGAGIVTANAALLGGNMYGAG
jgi:hypothetical protein